ncbi:MAG: Gfo/Idh/MocA family oxidoreductase [Patescibacteria group bacterium]|nr:Gfo/Idh/MocA family oxidoreductase [Patescibacteria group bacterium]
MKKNVNIGIIGAGLIGGKRAEAIAETKLGTIAMIADSDLKKAVVLAEKYSAEATAEWKEIIRSKDIDAVIVAVTNAFIYPIVLAAVKAGKHVLCEKPFGIDSKESKKMLKAAQRAKKMIKVGFNHRFLDHVIKARKIFADGGIGNPLFIRARYGHGGRKGMDKEWRLDKKISGGGELLDQGVHVVDLARLFGGEFDRAYGKTQVKYWHNKRKLDDNAFAIISNHQTTCSFHVSTTQWENIFSFEVFGDKGFLRIEGRGGRYGDQMLTYGIKAPVVGLSDLQNFNFGKKDNSWVNEWKNFIEAIAKKKPIDGNALDGLRANQIVEAIYDSSRKMREVKIKY